MRKMIILILFFGINVFALDFFNSEFKTTITEKSAQGIKKYTLDYSRDKIVVEILSPKVNKGEIYTYENNKKRIFYPILNEEVEQDYASEDNDIVLALSTLKDIKKSTVKDGKEYIVVNNRIEKILGPDYKIEFMYNKKNMISKIIARYYDDIREYEWNY